MSYHLLKYFALFLPITLLIYQLVPKKFRFIVLLITDYVFFYFISKALVGYLIFISGATYGLGIWIEGIDQNFEGSSKEKTKKKKNVLLLGVLFFLGILIILKYTNFFVGELMTLFNKMGGKIIFRPINFLVPIGISYYTLQTVSYLTDVYRGTQKATHNFFKIALYLSFFPQIMEGPISKYNEVADDLYAGNSLKLDNIRHGYERILWGLFKKMVVADRVAASVSNIFTGYAEYDGAIIMFGVLMYTCQLYMEFSGCMDIIIGSGELFGVTLPENFRQPFLAKDASDFWHRWHITLGRWFKDYIFYPISLAKPVKNLAKKFKEKFGKNVSKFVAPTIALFCVWSSNGLWHGARWTYIFYGMYYFVIIFLENIFEAPVAKLTSKLHINREGKGYRVFRIIKLFIIINVGEMFFRADTVKMGFEMLWSMITNFHFSAFWNKILFLGMDQFDLVAAGIGVLLVTIVGIFREKGINIRYASAKWPLPIKWAFWYGLLILVLVFGAYGAGYDNIAMIYAGY